MKRILTARAGFLLVFNVLSVVLQLLTAQGAAAPSIDGSAIPTIQKPRNQVQGSGFGDPNGVLNIALGSYDMPVGLGYSNGAGGAAFGNTTEEKRTLVKPPPTVSLARPMEITSRPKPIYTDEARANKTEGTAVLQVTFYRDGQVIIEHIVQELPNGLTNTAVKAARGIRFHPALDSDGQATDFTAQVRVKFLLDE
jgi:TonB family protein